jgi:hypothetical protein
MSGVEVGEICAGDIGYEVIVGSWIWVKTKSLVNMILSHR